MESITSDRSPTHTPELFSEMSAEEDSSIKSKRRRPNTTIEKRRMRKESKKRMRNWMPRKSTEKLKRELKEAQSKADQHMKKILKLSAMARSFWERWRWELQKRKEALLTSRRMSMQLNSSKQSFPMCTKKKRGTSFRS